MTGGKEQKGRAGFTLMEVLVVVAIFSTAMVAVTDMFLIANRAERKVLGREELAATARVAVEQMARGVRRGSIDYARYADPAEGGPLGLTDTRLFLSASGGGTFSFRRSESGCPTGSSPCLLVEENGETASLTPEGAVVEQFMVVVNPITDPFVSPPGSVVPQPSVTVVLALRSGSGASAASVRVQTTVASRLYVR
ncbi:type II secretion system protein [Patescibacteria group bacterium]|nr:MAG: type II secretion system protein [Patescibacteria group bacterium]